MNSRALLTFSLIVFIAIGLFFTSRRFSNPEKSPATLWEGSKQYPFEDFFLQQAYPEAMPNVKNFETALQQIKQREIFRNAPVEFDHAWTTQGPGNIGARINSVTTHPTNADIIYAGFSDGGVFKSIDGGQSWVPIFDDQNFLAIGDIVLDPNDPETVYVGTGDPNISGFPSIGDGLYRSKDGGQTWSYLGLRDQRIISKIIIDPNNSNTIFVSTMGIPFERNRDRGLYKSVDAGQTWNQVLFLSEQTGVIDFLLNPQNPQTLYAAGWDRIRNNKESTVRGDGAKIYKSLDGGDNWIQLTQGLPDSASTRIGLAMSAQNPDVVYAMYTDNDLPEPCSGTGYNLLGIFKSTDGGANWTMLPTLSEGSGLPCSALGGFGWYFGKLRVNPNDDNDLFLLGVDLWRTKNGGQNWDRATPPWWEYAVHADKHDLIFTPDNKIMLATDGGLYRANLDNEEWEDIENIPATQFYRVAYNPHNPEAYYGGAQDNGTSGGNKSNINEWDRIYGADGFQTVFHPENPDIFYAETQNGGIVITLDGGNVWWGATEGIDRSDSQNWDMPYRMSSHDPAILYAGTDRVYQSISDSLPFWEPISMRLSANENDYRDHNLSALSESPIEADLIYATTSDAQVWRGKVSTEEWTNISVGLPIRYVSDVIASSHNEATVFVSHSGYKDNDNTPLLHRSDDFGANWTSIAGDLPPIAINEILVLPEQADSVIFAATDAGIYATTNSGQNWHRLGNNMPMIPCFDMVWNEAKNELVAGTFARGIQSYPLDSLGLENVVNTAVDNPLLVQDIIKLYPNPTSDGAWLDFQSIESNKAIELALIDAQGRLVKQENLGKISKVKHYIDLENLPKGVYFLKIKIRHEVISRRLVLQ